MSKEKLKKIMKKWEKEYIQGLQGAIQIPSVEGKAEEGAPYGPGPRQALDYALDLGEKLGFQPVNVDNHCGYIEYGDPDADMVAVLGHLDVVPVSGDWDYPPFSGEIHDGYLYGRGVMDDKGMAIGAIYALAAIKEAGFQLDHRVRVLFGTNEESGSAGIQYYLDQGGEKPIMGITPDAEFPLIYFEKGRTEAWLGVDQAKQGDIEVLSFQAGEAPNSVPEEASLVLAGEHDLDASEGVEVEIKGGKTYIEARGKAAHGSTPELGISAINRLFQAVRELGIGGDFQKLCDFFCDKIGTDPFGKGLGVYYEDRETGKTSVNPGLAGWKDGRLYLVLDIRYPKQGDHEEVRKNLEAAIHDYDLTILDRDLTDCLYVPKDSALVQKLMKVYQEETGDMDSQPLAIGGGTYAKLLPNMVAFGPVFPGEESLDHQPNERYELTKLLQAWHILGQAILALATK